MLGADEAHIFTQYFKQRTMWQHGQFVTLAVDTQSNQFAQCQPPSFCTQRLRDGFGFNTQLFSGALHSLIIKMRAEADDPEQSHQGTASGVDRGCDGVDASKILFALHAHACTASLLDNSQKAL